MKLFSVIAMACAMVVPAQASASTFCAELAQVDQLPKKYAKRGPFHADEATGWIVGEDQLKSSFDVTEEVEALWVAIEAEFASRGTQLMVLAAPPRPLFAPTSAVPKDYDRDHARLAFSTYIERLNSAGIAAPDLTEVTETPMSDAFYFARDTHWTPKGAAISAVRLADLSGQLSGDLDDISFADSYAEKGSLSAVVEATCGVRPDAEVVPAPSYAKVGGADALLSGGEDASIALVGTSFSDRYKTDSYQVSGALAHAFGREVENFSVTGGGLVGAMGAFIQSGALERGQFETVVWETPYTSPLTNVSGLRQVLGQLQAGSDLTELYAGPITSDWKTVKLNADASKGSTLQIETPGVTDGRLVVELYDADDKKLRVKLVKSDRIAAEMRSDIWSLSLTALPIATVKKVKLKLESASADGKVMLIN